MITYLLKGHAGGESAAVQALDTGITVCWSEGTGDFLFQPAPQLLSENSTEAGQLLAGKSPK